MKADILNLLRDLDSQSAKALKSKHKTQHKVMQQTASELYRSHIIIDNIILLRELECAAVIDLHRKGVKFSPEFLSTQSSITRMLSGCKLHCLEDTFSVSKGEMYELWDDLAAAQSDLSEMDKFYRDKLISLEVRNVQAR